MANVRGVWIGLTFLILISIVIVIASGIRIIRPYQKGLVEALGPMKKCTPVDVQEIKGRESIV